MQCSRISDDIFVKQINVSYYNKCLVLECTLNGETYSGH